MPNQVKSGRIVIYRQEGDDILYYCHPRGSIWSDFNDGVVFFDDELSAIEILQHLRIVYPYNRVMVGEIIINPIKIV